MPTSAPPLRVHDPALALGPGGDEDDVRLDLSSGRRLARVVAVALLVLSSPLLLALALVHRLTMGRPFLYRGTRLGENGTHFQCLKIRTLPPGAEELLGSECFTPECGLANRFGRALRSSRLDELAQLVNVARGEMGFVGPRPERPARGTRSGRGGRRAASRLRPGLTGWSQIFTPHGSPARIRELLDRTARRQARWPSATLALTTAVSLPVHAVRLLSWALSDAVRRPRTRGVVDRDRRSALRARGFDPREMRVRARVKDDAREVELALVDANRRFLRVDAREPLPIGARIELTVRCRAHHGRRRFKCVRCIGEVVDERAAARGHGYLLRHRPRSGLQRYLFDQYVLRASIA